MPNSNYVKGRAFEYKVKKFYEGCGYLVFRTAGSHSPADLIAFAPLGNIKEWNPILIQCKAGKTKITKQEVDKLKSVAEQYGLRARVAQNKNGCIAFAWIVSE